MADVLTPQQRHKNMSRIRGKDTSIEIQLRKALFSKGFRYRKNVASLPGKPDIVLPKYHTVIFVNGCFWHRHKNCPLATMPATRVEFWNKKFADTVVRDREEQHKLEQEGWHVIIVWECELRKNMFEQTVGRVVSDLKHQL